MTAFKDSFCQNNSWFFIYITAHLSPCPPWAVIVLLQHSVPISSSCSWGLRFFNQPSQVKVEFTPFLCNDSSELVLPSSLAECRGKCLFLLSVFSESGWRSAQGAVLWPFFRKSLQVSASCGGWGEEAPMSGFWSVLLWFSGCKSVLSKS